ncbi:MAG: hypothetical protein COZ46_03465 [Verrucomicrobia bacterium CG_4_10_14_3_um_filter_43_23]|nr:MAG: hypothetical protein AUJ82_07705 [Verrucomicrobia bacterium CG1_02_43_26]PIP58657.1 MAG: hypothetical protein COX01_07930 [Verrucomicrobia bacterium CG22_combo_CG10-13_8_21_14_all_43_17]PIX58519.1 MAG: hypothetical protein COZ46_03465 [Verrucomicrobia bacterium CG_4_10_14_3_um_filter_43_23]PIY61251.1 MAG: hypothetical protein COY94_06580 [Verrucomicrobia bacterium CG_4_10_14_0_8_um_filter_43_34]PJA43559.1 MAG: hypothetical protein CO175_07455 [Verrucomicrobia bacterium CG_4_9_14_3_um_fi
MNQQDFIRNVLSHNNELFRLIYQFDTGLADYINKEQLKGAIKDSLPGDLFSTPRLQKKISAYLINQLKLKSCFYSFKEPRLRIALLPEAILEQVLLYAGAAFYSDTIKHIVLKKKLTELQASIGEKVYIFATKKAPLLSQLVPHISVDKSPAHLDKDQLINAGKACIEACFAKEPEALTQRFKLKFPPSVHFNFNQEISPELKTQCWNFLQRLIIKELAPEWKSCFA